MKFAMIFLVLTLVVLMTETGECACFLRLGRALAGKSHVNTQSGSTSTGGCLIYVLITANIYDKQSHFLQVQNCCDVVM
uniref:Chemokine interleukin-8-like domain-containing protein n=1 Tax=Lates calcarifer TaxID=8187 RepID=A0A4W6DE45_LATCA